MRLFTARPAIRDVAAIAHRILETPALVSPPAAPIYRALTNLPPFRPVVVNLMQMFGREDAGALEISRLIEGDPALASEVLTLANSPLFGLTATVKSLNYAITILGVERIKALSSVIALRIMMDGAPKTNALRRCWRHCIACAHISRELAPFYDVPPEQAYTAGILHDIGRFGLMATNAEQYGQLCCTMYETPGDILATETSCFQSNHCQIGLFLAASWRLPEFFHGAVSQHHRRERGQGVVPLTQVACLMADSIGMDAICYKLPKPAAVMTLLKKDARRKFASQLEGIERTVAESIKALDF